MRELTAQEVENAFKQRGVEPQSFYYEDVARLLSAGVPMADVETWDRILAKVKGGDEKATSAMRATVAMSTLAAGTSLQHLLDHQEQHCDSIKRIRDAFDDLSKTVSKLTSMVGELTLELEDLKKAQREAD